MDALEEFAKIVVKTVLGGTFDATSNALNSRRMKHDGAEIVSDRITISIIASASSSDSLRRAFQDSNRETLVDHVGRCVNGESVDFAQMEREAASAFGDASEQFARDYRTFLLRTRNQVLELLYLRGYAPSTRSLQVSLEASTQQIRRDIHDTRVRIVAVGVGLFAYATTDTLMDAHTLSHHASAFLGSMGEATPFAVGATATAIHRLAAEFIRRRRDNEPREPDGA